MNRQRKPMKISTRFFILISVLFILNGIINIILVSYQMRRMALIEAEQTSRDISNRNLAIHTYFTQQLKPKLFELTDPIRSKDYFDPTWMSSTYAIREINKYFGTLGASEYYYKECAINARSPENEANDYEKAFLEDLGRNPELVMNSDVRSLQGKRFLVVLRRGEEMVGDCLRCHGEPEQAPGDLVRYYGRERSFHRKVGDVVQAVSIRVPLSAAYTNVGHFSLPFLGLRLIIFILLFGSLYWLSKRWVFQPLDNIREKAMLISAGSEHLGEEIPFPAGRELYDLTLSFNRMSESLRLNSDILEERIRERTEELSISNEHLKREIQERVKKEEELCRSEERYRSLFNNMISGVAIYQSEKNGEDFILVDFNKSGEMIDNISKENIIGQSVQKIFPGIKDFGLFDVFKRVWKTGKTENHPVAFYKDERISGWRANSVYKLPSGEIVAIYSDENERKRAEEEREKLQAQLSSALEMAHLGPWECDVPNNLFTFNDYFYKIFRTTADEVGGYTMKADEYAKRFLYPDDLHLVGEEMQKAIETTDPHFSRQLEHRIIYADGTVGHITVRFFVVKDANGRTVRTYGVNQDITERKRMEEELLRVQKLESVGLLAGGIAHDFNNILTMIMGNIAMARMRTRAGDDVFELLSEAETASTRAQTLTRQLLTFARGGAPVKEIASIKDILKESSLFVLRGSKSVCEFSMAEDLRPAEVDIGQISQVINNIVINANQAMPEGGTIRIAAENLIIEDRHGLPVKPGRYIKISITDQGIGIAEKHLSNVFDPYFTTKHEGSGLGLATSYSIIKKHDGHITVESELGKGATFHIYLPATERAIPEKEEVKPIKGRGRVLVMDDEAALRKMVGRMLKNLGYESEFANDGAEAIEKYKTAMESGKPYDAVILDLTVPGGMGGKEAIKKLLDIDPEVKAIVSSGYSQDTVLANFQEYGFKGMLPKPFEARSLSKVLHDVLKGGN